MRKTITGMDDKLNDPELSKLKKSTARARCSYVLHCNFHLLFSIFGTDYWYCPKCGETFKVKK